MFNQLKFKEMNKKVLFIALGCAISAIITTNAAETEKVGPKELAKEAVIESSQELLEKVQLRLKDRNESKVKIGKLPEGKDQQFLYQEELIDSILKPKTHALKDVFGKLCDKSNMPTDMHFEEMQIGDITYKIIETGKKQGQTDSTRLIVPVTFQTRTIAKDNVSNVKYKVEFNWEVKVKQEVGKVEIEGKKSQEIVQYVVSGMPTLVSSVVTPISLLTSDKEAMKRAAQDAVVAWYANLPQTLDKQYAEQSIETLNAVSISRNDVKMDLPESREFEVTDVPTITINIDPYKVIERKGRDKSLYTNPLASLLITPVFNISVDETYSNAKVIATYVVEEVLPTTDAEKEKRKAIAPVVINDLATKLAEYVATRTPEQKQAIEEMFETAESNIDVSYMPKSGKERIRTKPIQKYLSLLKGLSINQSVVESHFLDPNFSEWEYVINQEYNGKIYSDFTQKVIYLKYDEVKGTYLINKITVVPNTTKLK